MEIKKIQDCDFKLTHCSEHGLRFKDANGSWFIVPDNFIFKINLFDNKESFREVCHLDISYFFTNINNQNYFRMSLMNENEEYIEILINKDVYEYKLFFEEKEKSNTMHTLGFLEFSNSMPFDEKNLVLYYHPKLDKLFLEPKAEFLKTQPLKVQAESYLKMINGCAYSVKKEKDASYNKHKNNVREEIKVYVDGSYDVIKKHKKATIKNNMKKKCSKLNKLQIEEISDEYIEHYDEYNEDVLYELFKDKIKSLAKPKKKKKKFKLNNNPIIKEKFKLSTKPKDEKKIDAEFILDNSDTQTQTLFPKEWFNED